MMKPTMIDPANPQYALDENGELLERCIVAFGGMRIDNGYFVDGGREKS